MLYRLTKYLIIFALVIIAILAILFAYVYNHEELEANNLINYSPNISSEILDRNGKRIAFIFNKRHRLYARYDEIPGYMVEALVAVEDTRFFEHHGINPDAILRAAFKDIKARRFVEGGSTLTQQLIKNALLTRKKTLMRKIKEAVLAIKIENKLTKEQIMERYLNELFLGNNYYGVKTAAFGYFHKKLNELTLKECAILMGLPRGPSFYDPIRHYKRALNRANTVLGRMRKIGWISKKEYIKAIKETPKVYKSSLTQNVAPYIVDEILRRFKGRFSDLKTGGYKIYTTIDLNMQEIARKAVKYGFDRAVKRYKYNPKTTKFNGALIAVENKTGDILAMVGGENYHRSAFNRVTMARRQPGSSFKPFIYQTALDMGYNPATKLTDIARTFQYRVNGQKRVWAPKNYERNFEGFISLRDALVHSRNLATINLVYDIGVEVIRKRLALLDVPNIPNDLSIALGNLAISPYKMAQMYTVFSNGGHMIEPRLVNKIVSKENAILYETKPKEIANFTKPRQAYLMTSILQDVIKRGTGRNAAVKGIELAGKTGTTNNSVDTWFCGYSPTITTIVWYGKDNNHRIGRGATGGSIAAPAFAYFYKNLLKKYPNMPRKFIKPDGVYIGTIKNGKKELYTDISPLPNQKIDPSKLFDDNLTLPQIDKNNTNPSPKADMSQQDSDNLDSDNLDDGVEVINLDDEPIQESQDDTSDNIEPSDNNQINPLHLRHIKPQRVGEDSGSLF